MILYHFTSIHHIKAVKKQGLTRGMIPCYHKADLALLPGYQWLTENPSHDQEWSKGVLIKYDRTKYRITIKIPAFHQGQVLNWLDFCAKYPGRFDMLNTYGDPYNWHLFKGHVLPEWFVKIDKKKKKRRGRK